MDAQDNWLVVGWATLHLAGLVAAWLSRLPLGRWAARANHGLLLTAFLAIAGIAVLHLATSYQLSLLSATTLGVITVAAVWDGRQDDEDQLLSRVVAAYE